MTISPDEIIFIEWGLLKLNATIFYLAGYALADARILAGYQESDQRRNTVPLAKPP